MSAFESPVTASTLPISPPLASTTCQPGSIRSHETGSAITASCRSRARPVPACATWREPDTARRTETLPSMPRGVAALEAAARHLGRDAVPLHARARGSAAPRALPSRRGLHWMQSTAAGSMKSVEVSSQLDVEVAPVGRQPGDRAVPRRCQGRDLALPVHLVASAWDPESESAPFGTLRSSARQVVRARGAAVARDVEEKHRGSGAVGACRSEHGGRPVGGRAVRQREAQLAPASTRSEARIQWLSTASATLTAGTYTPGTLAKVEREAVRRRGDAARVPARDAPDPPLRGEGRGAVPRRRAARVPARRDRPGGGRGRRLQRDGGRRRLRVDAPRARPHARARHAPERGDGGALREARGLLARLRRLDAPLRRRARQLRRERRRRRRPAGGHRRRASRSSCATSRASRSRSSATARRTSARSTSRSTSRSSGRRRRVFVCENNHWAESTPGWQHSPVWDDMSKRALAYDMRSIKVDGQDVEAVYDGGARGARARALRRRPGVPRRRDLPHARPLHRRPAGLPLEGGPRGGGRPRSDPAAARAARPLRRGVRGVRRRGASRSSRTRSSSRRTAPTRSPKTR